MPYIKGIDRDRYDPLIQQLSDLTPDDPGHINYIITKFLTECYGVSYKQINEAIGVLECAKMEFYRRVASPYEDKKVIENGDVY